MSNSIPAGIIIEYDNAAGTPVNISQHVQELSSFKVEGVLEEKHTFGDAWEEFVAIGLARVSAVTFGGLYDDTASTGPDALFANRIPENPATANVSRTLKITWLSGKTSSVETILRSYERSPDRNAMTRFSVELQPTGAVTEV